LCAFNRSLFSFEVQAFSSALFNKFVIVGEIPSIQISCIYELALFVDCIESLRIGS
jgi:hypothetical protein